MRNCCLYYHCNPSVLHRPFSKLFHVLVQRSLVNYMIFSLSSSSSTINLILLNKRCKNVYPNFCISTQEAKSPPLVGLSKRLHLRTNHNFVQNLFFFSAILFCEPNCHSYFVSQFFVYSKLLEEMTAENTRLTEILKVKEETERKQAGTACLL